MRLRIGSSRRRTAGIAALGVLVLSAGVAQISRGAGSTPLQGSIGAVPSAVGATTPVLPAPPGATPFLQGYTAPTTPLLTASAVLANAPKAAANAGDAAPTGIQAVSTTVGKGLAAMAPGAGPPGTPSGGLAAFMGSQAYLVVVHGHFSLPHAAIPSGAALPTGTVLEFLIDARTNRAYATQLSNNVPTPLAKLGAVTAAK